MVGQMKHILATEQRKTDFRPEDENNVMIQYTTVRDAWLLALRSHAKKKTNQQMQLEKYLQYICLCSYTDL